MHLQAALIRRKAPNLIPMIDVMVLLLVFFMLASRFGGEQGVPLQVAGAASGYAGPPRLVQIDEGGITLNGVGVTEADLPGRLAALMGSPDDVVVLRAGAAVNVQRMVDIAGLLHAAGLTRVALVE